MARLRPSLRVVIGAVVASTVLVVAALTLAITYTIAVAAVRDIGRTHALALAATVELQAEEHFEKPARDLDTWQGLYGYNDWVLLSEDPRNPDPSLLDANFYFSYQFHHKRNFTYGSMGIIFDDPSGTNSYVRTLGTTGRRILYWTSRSAWQFPQRAMIGKRRAVDLATGIEVSQADLDLHLEPFEANLTTRLAVYDLGLTLVGDGSGFWFTMSAYYPIGSITPQFALAAVKPIYNATLAPRRFLGFAILTQPVAVLNDFLAVVQRTATPNTQIFIVDGTRFLVASTHPTPHYSFTLLTTAAEQSEPLRPGCVSTTASSFGLDPGVSRGCRTAASDFDAYPPLVAASREDSGRFVTGASPGVRMLNVDGTGNVFVATARIDNSYRFFSMAVILCMPESDILGDIVAGRNTAIIVTVMIFIVVTAIVLVVVNLLLQPLSDVSRQMMNTAKLKEPENSGRLSRLEEVATLQRSYANMNTAISNFTRYVPRDVVKDLMSSGQLCEIKMVPQQCTMLFVDIAGFTTVCERVPPDALSELVSQYFDRASRLVMEHDGLIDKFIGDCIMAVWGAPFAIANQEVKATLTAVLINRATIAQPLAGIWDDAGEILRVRVGVSTGEVLAGNMGSADRMNYTVIGDPVNLAARLESLNKQFDTRVMVSEMTAEGLGGVFVLRLLMPIAVVGKEKPVRVYEVMGLARQFTEEDVARFQLVDDDYGVDGESSESEMDMRSAISIRSQMSVQEAAEKKRKGSKATIVMLRECAVQTAADTPVTCTIEQAAMAQQHTDAVHLYLNRQFAEAAAAFARMEQQLPSSLTGGESERLMTVASNPMKSIRLVRDLCVKYAATGAPEDFDGVFRALEK